MTEPVSSGTHVFLCPELSKTIKIACLEFVLQSHCFTQTRSQNSGTARTVQDIDFVSVIIEVLYSHLIQSAAHIQSLHFIIKLLKPLLIF